MPGNKKDDAIASFFGDDELDWIDEEDSDIVKRPPEVEEAIAAAAGSDLPSVDEPPPPVDEGPTVEVDAFVDESGAVAANETPAADLADESVPEVPTDDRRLPDTAVQVVAGSLLEAAQRLDGSLPPESRSVPPSADARAPRAKVPERTLEPEISRSLPPKPAFVPPRFEGRSTIAPRVADVEEVKEARVGVGRGLPTPPEQGRSLLRQLEASGSAGPEVAHQIARTLAFRLGDPEGAQAALEGLNDRSSAWLRWFLAPEDPDALRQYAETLEGRHASDRWRLLASQASDTLACLERAIEHDPEDVAGHLHRLSVVPSEGREPALQDLAAAVGAPGRVVHDLERVRLRLEASDPDGAREALESARAASPDHPGVLAMSEALGLSVEVPEEPLLEGWTAWKEAERREREGPPAAATEAWRRAVRGGGLDPMSAWWRACRHDPERLADAARASVEDLGERCTPMVRWAAALAQIRVRRWPDAVGLLAPLCGAFRPADHLMGVLCRVVLDEPDEIEAWGGEGSDEDPVSLCVRATLLERSDSDPVEVVLAWKRAVEAGAPALERLLDAAARAQDASGLRHALRGLWSQLPEGALRSGAGLELALLERSMAPTDSGAVGRALDLIDEAGAELGSAAEDLKGWTLWLSGSPGEAGRHWRSMPSDAGPTSTARTILAATLLRRADPEAAWETLEPLGAQDGASGGGAVHDTLAAWTQLQRLDLLHESFRSLGGRDGAGAAWLLAWFDGADLPVGEQVTGRGLLLALRAATATDPVERVRRWEDAAGGGVVRMAARAEAMVDSSPSVAAIILEGSHEDASPALARLAWRAGRPDLALRLQERAEGVSEASRAWLRVAAATSASALASAIEGLDKAHWGPLWAAVFHPHATNEVIAKIWQRLAEHESAPTPLRVEGARRCALRDLDGAAAWWERVLRWRPGEGEAFDAQHAALVDAADADGLRALYERHAPGERRRLAEALDRIGAWDPSVWEEVAERPDGTLYDAISWEIALQRAERFDALYDRWRARLAEASGEEAESLRDRCRWLLANRLAHTDRALEALRALREEHPEDQAIQADLARVEAAHGRLDEARRILSDLRESAQDPADRILVSRWTAQVMEDAEAYEEARAGWRQVLESAPEDLPALQGLRRIAEAREEWEELRVILNRQRSILKGHARSEATRSLARLLQGPMADLGGARENWQEVLHAAPDDLEAMTALLDIAIEEGEVEEVRKVGRALLQKTSGAERQETRSRIGVVLERAGRLDDALEVYVTGVDDAPVDVASVQAAVRVAQEVGDVTEHLRGLITLAEAADDPDASADLLAQAARIELTKRFDRDAAHRLFAQALDRAPTHPDALKFEATWLYEAARYDEALDVHRRLAPVMELDDLDDPDTRVDVTTFYHRFGSLLEMKGDPQAAFSRWSRVLELNPSHLPTLRALGPLAARSKDWPRVREVYSRLLELTGGQGEPAEVAEMYAMLGASDLHEGRLDKARKRILRALEVRPGFVPALQAKALLHERAGEWKSALEVYHDIIQTASPDEEEGAIIGGFLDKARILDEQLGHGDKAREHLAGCLAFKPGEPRGLLRMMEMSIRALDWEDASEYAQQALNGDLSDHLRATAWLGLARARRGMEDEDGARGALVRSLKLDRKLAGTTLTDEDDLHAKIKERLP